MLCHVVFLFASILIPSSAEPQCEIVIAYCAEGVEAFRWLTRDIAAEFGQIRIVSKCKPAREIRERWRAHQPSPLDFPNVVIDEMRNVGSNDGAYLRHIITRWEQLSPITLFCEPHRSQKHKRIVAWGSTAPCDGMGCFESADMRCVGSIVLRPDLDMCRIRASSAATMCAAKLRALLNEQSDAADDGSEAFRRGLYEINTHRRRAALALTKIASYDFQAVQHRSAVELTAAARSGGGAGGGTGDATGGSISTATQPAFGGTGKAPVFSFVKSEHANMLSWLRATAGDPLASLILSGARQLVLGGWQAAERSNLHRYPLGLFKTMHEQQVAPNAEVDQCAVG